MKKDIMKKGMRVLRIVVVGAALAAGAAVMLQAQPVQGSETGLMAAPRTEPRAEPIAFSVITEKKRIECDFEDTPVLEVINYLREHYKEVNFVAPRSLRDSMGGVQVEIKLRSAGLRDVLEALSIATDGRVNYEVRSPTLVAFYCPALSPATGESTPEAAVQPKAPRQVHEVVNLRSMLGVRDREKAWELVRHVEAITAETLAAVRRNDTPSPDLHGLQPQFNFHPPTGILVITGPEESVKMARKILASLDRQEIATPPAGPPPPPAKPDQEREKR
jgi:type II secretory pathway component GspD/PulD (secretin)